MSIEELHDLLKEEEFGHGVGDLIDHPTSRTAYENNFLDLPDATTGERASQRGTSEPKGNRVSTLVLLISLRAALKGMGKVPVGLVWILTLVISRGQRAISAMTSAEAEPASQIAGLYLFESSSPAMFMYVSLKTS